MLGDVGAALGALAETTLVFRGDLDHLVLGLLRHYQPVYLTKCLIGHIVFQRLGYFSNDDKQSHHSLLLRILLRMRLTIKKTVPITTGTAIPVASSVSNLTPADLIAFSP